MNRLVLASALSLSAAALATSGTAVAGTGPHPAAPAEPVVKAAAPAALPAGLPAGYVSLQSALLPAPAHKQSGGSLACPTGKVPLGGGALVSSSDLNANINSSFPSGASWLVDVNNGSSFATTFRVFVICAKQPNLYQVITTAPVTAPAGIQGHAIAACPTGTVVFGGGGFSFSGLTTVNLNSTFDAANGWRTDMNNASTSPSSFESLAICAKKPKGYVTVDGPDTTLTRFSSGFAQAFCPGVTLPLSGGVANFGGDVNANLNATFPTNADGWFGAVNNNTIGSFPISARMVCAGV
jgi:hypothetical protein